MQGGYIYHTTTDLRRKLLHQRHNQHTPKCQSCRKELDTHIILVNNKKFCPNCL